MILDLILPRKSKYYVAAFALLGTLFSLAPLVIQWANYTTPTYAFEGSFVVDKFSIILNLMKLYLCLVNTLETLLSSKSYDLMGI